MCFEKNNIVFVSLYDSALTSISSSSPSLLTVQPLRHLLFSYIIEGLVELALWYCQFVITVFLASPPFFYLRTFPKGNLEESFGMRSQDMSLPSYEIGLDVEH